MVPNNEALLRLFCSISTFSCLILIVPNLRHGWSVKKMYVHENKILSESEYDILLGSSNQFRHYIVQRRLFSWNCTYLLLLPYSIVGPSRHRTSCKRFRRKSGGGRTYNTDLPRQLRRTAIYTFLDEDVDDRYTHRHQIWRPVCDCDGCKTTLKGLLSR